VELLFFFPAAGGIVIIEAESLFGQVSTASFVAVEE
jgi:hypothetical protein